MLIVMKKSLVIIHAGKTTAADKIANNLRSYLRDSKYSWTFDVRSVSEFPDGTEAKTADLVKAADIIVCLGKRTFDEASDRMYVDARKTMVWNEDRFTVSKLEKKCREFVDYISAGSWIDVVEKDGTPTGLSLPVSWVTERGFWHRGAHIVLLTETGHVVLQVRSNSHVYRPGEIDITLGGFVDSGETPIEAILRELNEEMGISLRPDQIKLLRSSRMSTRIHSLNALSRTIQYDYVGVIGSEQVMFRPEFSEVSGIALCTKKQVKDLLLGKKLPYIGKLTTQQAYYNQVVPLAFRASTKMKK